MADKGVLSQQCHATNAGLENVGARRCDARTTCPARGGLRCAWEMVDFAAVRKERSDRRKN